MSLYRRDETGRSRARRAHRSRCRARMQLACSARFGLEELESRVLLNASSGQPPVSVFTLALPVTTAAISTLAQPAFAVPHLAIAEDGFTSGLAESGSLGIVVAHLRLATPTNPPTLTLVGSSLPEGDPPTNFAITGAWSPPLNEGQVSPLLVATADAFRQAASAVRRTSSGG